MNRRKWLLPAAVLVLIGSTAIFLSRLQANYKLGRPGLKMTPKLVYSEKGEVVCTNTVDLPEQVLDYVSEPLPVTAAELGWLPRDTTYGYRAYLAPDKFQLVLRVVLMGTDRGSIHKPQFCLTGQGWTIEQSDLLKVRVSKPEPHDLPLMRLTATKQLRRPDGQTDSYRGIFVYWFVAEDRVTARHGQRMWWMAQELLKSGTLERWAYVSCFALCRSGEEAATYRRMEQFLAAAVPEFQLTRGSTPRLAANR